MSDKAMAIVRKIIDAHGRWERYMKGGKWMRQKVISRMSYNKMMQQLGEHFNKEAGDE